MAAQNSLELAEIQGPSGFIEFGGHMLVVDYGRIYMEGAPVGFLFEDGYMKDTAGIFGNSGQSASSAPAQPLIDNFPGCAFRGIDAQGMELELPTNDGGPSGSLKYNGIDFKVINGRIVSSDHKLVGELTDEGILSLRDGVTREPKRELDEFAQLTTIFDGTKSDGSKWNHEFIRPLSRRDKTYSESEIIRYFQEFDKLTGPQKKYVTDTLNLWAATGLLQVVRKSEGNCMLGNIKHGAAGVTGVRSGYVTLDRDEFVNEIELFRRLGSMATLPTKFRPFIEVRVNLVVAHEFGHQVEFVLSQATQERIRELYEDRRKRCEKLHPFPPGYDGQSELLETHQIERRLFISGYARSSEHEYWAECLAAFSMPDGRAQLKVIDPAIYNLLKELVLTPQNLVRRVLHDQIMNLQASLRVGGELTAELLRL